MSTFDQEFQRRLRKLLGVADGAYVFVELRGSEWELVEDLEAVDEQEDPA